MNMQSLTQLYTVRGLFRDADGDGLPDGLNVRFSVGRTPGAVDVAARLGLESAALTPGFTAAGADGIPVWFGPDNPDCPATPRTIPADAGLVALAAGGVLVTGATPRAGRDAARWLAETFPFAAPGGPLLSELAGGRPVTAVIICEGSVVDLTVSDGPAAATVDKLTVEGAPPAPPFVPEPVGDLPPEGPARLFSVEGLMGSSDGIRHDRAGWQVVVDPVTTADEIAALCELAARTGVEAVGLAFPFVVEAPEAGRPAVTLADAAPAGAAWVEGHLAWAPGGGLTAFGTAAERAAALRAAAGAGLVAGLHATLFTSRAGLPEARADRGEPVFDLALEQEWEVERFRRAWQGVLPALAPGRPVTVDLRLSEPLAVREAIAEAMARDLAARGVPEARLRVLSAYKQGFHWLEEELLPQLQALGGALARVQVTCARFAAGDDALEMPIRWLQELYPADELLGAALGVPVAFDLADGPQPDIYRLIAYGADGTALLVDSFNPVSSARQYLPEFPHRGRVHPPTGLLRVEQGGRLLLETAIDTDAEAFWTAWQEQVLPRLRAYVVDTYGPVPDAGAQPFFGALVVEAALSEDDRRLGIREEQISPLDAMHEDLYFYTLDYLNELGVQLTGKGYPAPGAVEPWVVAGEGGGPRARVRLYVRPEPAAAPAAVAGPTATAGALPAPAPGIPLNVLIGPDQLPPYLAYLATLPGVRVWRTGLSYAGRPTWAMSVTAPTAGAIAPPQKLSAWRPTLLVNARHHANEVSSTNSILKLTELVARDGTAARVNLVISPLENVDGAAIHYAMQEAHPHWKLHAARFNAAGMEFAADAFTRAPRFGEAHTVPTLWRAFQPDVFLDDHGYPSHEWVQPFSGYNSPPYFKTSWWVPNALIYSIHRWMDAERFPGHGAVQEALRDALAERLTADPEIHGYTQRLLERYQTYGRSHVPDKFPLEQYRGFIALAGNPVPTGPDARTYVGRFPHITSAELVTEVPDETAQGDYLALCARAHLEGDLAVLGYLKERLQPVLRRRWTEGATTWWATGRNRLYDMQQEPSAKGRI